MASLSVFLKIEETEMVANEEATAIEQDAEMVALVANQAEDNHEMDMKVWFQMKMSFVNQITMI